MTEPTGAPPLMVSLILILIYAAWSLCTIKLIQDATIQPATHPRRPANFAPMPVGNFNELRDWPNAQVATGAFTLASLCYFGGQVPGVEDYANGYIWR